MKNSLKNAGFIAASIAVMILLFCLLNPYQSNQPPHLSKDFADIKKIIKTGDLILRQGTGADSLLIRELSDSDYSHIGIVTADTPDIIITHADADDMDRVTSTSIDDFLSEDNAKKAALLRYDFLSGHETDWIVSKVLTHIGEEFELSVKGDDNHPMYCTLLIYEAIKEVRGEFDLEFRRVDAPLVDGDYLFPQAFIDYDKTAVIYEK